MNSSVTAKMVTLVKHLLLAGMLFSGVVLLLAFVTGTLDDPALVEASFWDSGY